MKAIIKLLLIGVIAIGAYFFYVHETKDVQPTVEVVEVRYEDILSNQGDVGVEDGSEDAEEEDAPEEGEEMEDTSNEVLEEQVVENGEIPQQFNLAVPFTSQAPHANWELPYQETCEEASAYMVAEYYKGELSGAIDPDVADAAILEAVSFEEDFFGYYLDTTAEETAQFIDFFYGLHATVVEDPTVDQIKAEIAAGRPVIVPTAGRELGNPNFSGLGPLYHMLVLRGYTQSMFITNDPGTRNGEGYVYDINVIMHAMGDWNNGDPENGAKRVIFVTP